jgi:hypothetical protein
MNNNKADSIKGTAKSVGISDKIANRQNQIYLDGELASGSIP